MTEPRIKKTTLACDSCRRRKRKCDGRTPVCSLCEKSNYECVYDATLDQRRPAQKTYVTALEARVALLESILKSAGADDKAGPSGLALVEENEQSTQETCATTERISVSVSKFEEDPTLPADSYTGFVPSDDAANTLESMTRPNPEQGVVGLEELSLGMEGYIPLINLATEHRLLARFWDWQRMHLPYVAPIPFLSAYAIHSEATHPKEPIPPPPPPPPPNPFSGPTEIGVPRAHSVRPSPELAQFISPLLLDCMFAIAALFHGELQMSEMFYQRAETRLFHEAANPRLATVQGVLMMSTYELGHARAPATWTLLGVSVALCTRLGMNIDATPLVRRGIMSKMLFETRNFVFWTTYNSDRFCAICMGMHPLMDRRMISTPRHSCLATANVAESTKSKDLQPAPGELEEKPTASNTSVSWWSPKTLGMGDVIIQAGWEAIRDLIRMSDMLFEKIYSFSALKRTPQEDLELVTRNNLTIQRFLDELPTWLRSTGAIRRKESGLVYLHLFTHLVSIVACRPFLSPRPLPEDVIRVDATADPTQPTHSSHIIRRYRTLAFRVARASALQITSLIRHIPLSSPCVTLPYAIYSASTILLLAPDDQAAMDGVRTGMACLESMDQTGYWVSSARDARDRVQALAKRWAVDIQSGGRKVLGPVGSAGTALSAGGLGESGSDGRGDFKDTGIVHPSTSSRNEGALPKTSNGGSSNKDASSLVQDPISGTTYSKVTPGTGSSLAHLQEYLGVPNQVYADRNYTEILLGQVGAASDNNDGAITPQERHHSAALQGYGQSKVLASGMVQPSETQSYDPPAYSHTDAYTKTRPLAENYASQGHQQTYHHAQQTHQQPHYQPPQPVQHIHYHLHSHTHQHQPTYHHTHNLSQPLPHVAYALSHAEPEHDMHLPHTHWHQVLPPADPNLPFPPDPVACTDIAVCFADTVQTGHDPAFIHTMADPYAGPSLDWLSDATSNFPTMTVDMYSGIMDGSLNMYRGDFFDRSGLYAHGNLEQSGAGYSGTGYSTSGHEEYVGGYGV